jgi:hypothetical protein
MLPYRPISLASVLGLVRGSGTLRCGSGTNEAPTPLP